MTKPAAPPKPELRQHVAALLRGGAAHATLEQALSGLSAAVAGKRPPRTPYSCWQLLEHLRIAQHDILEFTRDPAWQSPSWPEGYWPPTSAPPSAAAFRRSRLSVIADRDAMLALILDPAQDLLAPLPHAPDRTLLREALLLADHSAYHVGQIALVRKLLGDWPG
ncbi:MAG: DinB family protein [Terriglobales bacterium]